MKDHTHLPETAHQKASFERQFAVDMSHWDFHDTKDSFVRYLRDRRLLVVLKCLKDLLPQPACQISVLVICGGVGGEASFFANNGFSDVTNTDFSENALETCKRRDPRLRTLQINAEAINLPDSSYDLVVVQDGLHHLPRPVLGLNEMVRVARHAVVVLEPHTGLVAKAIGTEWEKHDETVNYVFRWNRNLFSQAILSQILNAQKTIKVIRLWDHGSMISKLVSRIAKGSRVRLTAARLIYALLTPFNFLGNNFIGILFKGQ